MELKDLIAKMTAIEEGIEVIGGPMPIVGHADTPKQQDSINMNVSLNGSGAQGVKDLMSILRDIENGVDKDIEPDHDQDPNDAEVEPLLGDMMDAMTQEEPTDHGVEHEEGVEEEMGDDGETWGNSAHGDSGAHVHGIDAVTATGNDMHKGTKGVPAFSPGNNTMIHYNESLSAKLKAMYEEIKGESIEEAYNPNNVSAQHARDMKAHHRAELKKKAEAGDESAKAMLKRAEEKDKAQRAEFDDRMERESIKENDHHEDEERSIRHLMRKYGWSRQEAIEYYYYEKHDPKDYEDMEESTINESNEILRLSKMLNG
jgi:hypothetical protein